METVTLAVEQDHAKEALKKYRTHRAAATAEDEAIMRAYREIARGRVIVQAHESVRKAGFNDLGRPRLALIRADRKECYYRMEHGARHIFFQRERWWRFGDIEIAGRCHTYLSGREARALVPLIPLYARPRKNLSDYHILWGAEWYGVPSDPMLLRKLSGDLWLVVAAWDLTAVERAVLANRTAG